TSIDRAISILALSSYAVQTGELGGDYSYKVQLDQSDILARLVKPNTAPTTASKTVPLATIKPGTTSLLAVTRDYPYRGTRYYSVDLRYVTPAKQIEALTRR